MRALIKWIVSAILAIVALGVTIGVIFLTNEKWQAQAADAFLEEATEWSWDLATVNLAWNRFEATGVFAMQHGQGFEVGEVDLGVSMVSLLKRDPVRVTGGHLEDCFLDLSTMPVSALGFSEEEFGRVPSYDNANGAVERMVMLSLERLAAEGLSLVIRDVRMEGSVLLPQDRSLQFDLLIGDGNTMAPEEVDLSITTARFR